MEDFYRLYQDLPLPDLVKVARTPSDYLPEAVAAEILRERGVTRDQIATEEWALAQKEIADGLRRGRLREYTAWIGELFGGDRMTPHTDRRLTALLLVYGFDGDPASQQQSQLYKTVEKSLAHKRSG